MTPALPPSGDTTPAATTREPAIYDLPDGRVITNGGRVLGVTALAEGLATARSRAYEAVGHIHWEGEHHRKDIAARKS